MSPEDPDMMDQTARLLIGLQMLDEDTPQARVAAMPPDIKADLYSTIQTRLPGRDAN